MNLQTPRKCPACSHSHEPNTSCGTCGHFWESRRFPPINSTNCNKFVVDTVGTDELMNTEQFNAGIMTHPEDVVILKQLSLRSLLAMSRIIFSRVFASEMGLQSEREAQSHEDEYIGEGTFERGGYSSASLSSSTSLISSGSIVFDLFNVQRYIILSVGSNPVGSARWRIVKSEDLGPTARNALKGGGSAMTGADSGMASPDYVALIDRFAICDEYRSRGCGRRLISAILNDVYMWAVKAGNIHNQDPLLYLPAVATLLPQVAEFQPALNLFVQRSCFTLLPDALPIAPYSDPSRIFSRAVHIRKALEDLNLESKHGTPLDPISLAAAGGSTTYTQLAVLMLPPVMVLDTLRRS